MRNLFIVLGLTIVFAIAGFIGTAESLIQMRKAGVSGHGLISRQDYSFIGGGVGAGIGFIIGSLIAIRLDRKKKQ